MLIVMSMEDGKTVREPVAENAEPIALPPSGLLPQLQLREIAIPAKAARPPFLDVGTFLASIDV